MACHVYIAAHDKAGGILHCLLTEDGQLHPVQMYPMDRPAYLASEGRTLYVLLREPFHMQSGVARFTVRESGALEQQGDIVPTHGAVAANLMVLNGDIYVTNYLSGTTVLLPDRILAHSGAGTDPVRQDCSHPHFVSTDPQRKTIYINDLGTDKIYICDRTLHPLAETSLPPGSGPRHLVFSPDGRYAYSSNELTSSVSVFAAANGHLRYLSSHSTLPGGYKGENAAAAIRISRDGKRLYVSNRGHDSVCLFRIAGDTLEQIGFLPSGGASPRDIYLSDEHLLCANELSGQVAVFPIAQGAGAVPCCIQPVTCPWCIHIIQL